MSDWDAFGLKLHWKKNDEEIWLCGGLKKTAKKYQKKLCEQFCIAPPYIEIRRWPYWNKRLWTPDFGVWSGTRLIFIGKNLRNNAETKRLFHGPRFYCPFLETSGQKKLNAHLYIPPPAHPPGGGGLLSGDFGRIQSPEKIPTRGFSAPPPLPQPLGKRTVSYGNKNKQSSS